MGFGLHLCRYTCTICEHILCHGWVSTGKVVVLSVVVALFLVLKASGVGTVVCGGGW
jgi:hypothetical protein